MCRVTLAQSHNFRISNEELQRSLNLRTINDYVTKNQLRRTSHGALISFDRHLKKYCLHRDVLKTSLVYLNILMVFFRLIR